MPDAPPTCMATGCANPAVDSRRELVEIQAWRRPADRANQRVFDYTGRLIYWCAEHEAVATASNTTIHP